MKILQQELSMLCCILLLFLSNNNIENVSAQQRDEQEEESNSSSRPTAIIKSSEINFQSRIVGGVNARYGEFPFMASWYYRSATFPSCGGSLIAPNLVLTAAHCGAIDGSVGIGCSIAYGPCMGGRSSVKSKIPHPFYVNGGVNHDYMVLELDSAVDTNIIQPIELNFDTTVPQTNTMLTVIGFGSNYEGGNTSFRLKKVDVPTTSTRTCRNQYGYGISPDIHLCAGYQRGGKDSCQGDSGGPLFLSTEDGGFTQMGVVSFGAGCARPNSSGVYARISGATDWLQSVICTKSSATNLPEYCNNDNNNGGNPTVATTPRPNTPRTASPTINPTFAPMMDPTFAPVNPTSSPTVNPTYSPTVTPTISPIDPTSAPIAPLASSPVLNPALSPVINPSSSSIDDSSPVLTVDQDEVVDPTSAPVVVDPTAAPVAPTFAPINPTSSPVADPTSAPTSSPVSIEDTNNDNCIECNNMPIAWMKAKELECTNSPYLFAKCNGNTNWENHKYCRLSCFIAGRGYEDDICCIHTDEEEKTMDEDVNDDDTEEEGGDDDGTEEEEDENEEDDDDSNEMDIDDDNAPIDDDDNSIEDCNVQCTDIPNPYMETTGQSCTDNTNFLLRKCKNNGTWRNHEYCKYSCDQLQLGYNDGEKCCPMNESSDSFIWWE